MTQGNVFPGRLAFEIGADEPALPKEPLLAYVERAHASLVANLPPTEQIPPGSSRLHDRLVRAVAHAYMLEQRLIERIED